MQKINSAESLRKAILELEIIHAEEGKLLKEQFHLVCESVKPVNIIKGMFKETFSSPTLKQNILNTSVGLAAGYLSKLLFANVSHNPLRKILGLALQFGITKVVTKHPEAVKSIGKEIVNNIKSKMSSGYSDNGHTETN